MGSVLPMFNKCFALLRAGRFPRIPIHLPRYIDVSRHFAEQNYVPVTWSSHCTRSPNTALQRCNRVRRPRRWLKDNDIGCSLILAFFGKALHRSAGLHIVGVPMHARPILFAPGTARLEPVHGPVLRANEPLALRMRLPQRVLMKQGACTRCSEGTGAHRDLIRLVHVECHFSNLELCNITTTSRSLWHSSPYLILKLLLFQANFSVVRVNDFTT